jgi:hypothetical protein
MTISLADSRVQIWFADVAGTNSVPIFRVCWWFGSRYIWTRRSAREYVIEFCRREIFNTSMR